jgi:hypothetical protein
LQCASWLSLPGARASRLLARAKNGVEKPTEGVEAEYRYISKLHGEKDKNWRIDGQTMYREEKNIFDVIEISLIPSSQKRIYYFDVSKFPWKRREAK